MRPSAWAVFVVALTLALAVAFASTLVGTTVPASRAMEVLAGADADPTERTIVLDVRLSRAALAFLVGAMLGMTGAAFQGLFRNPLADPFIVGSSGGAALGAVVAFVLGAEGTVIGISAMGVAAFAGALVITVAAFALASARGRVPLTSLLLVGFALGSFAGAVVTILLMLHSRNWNHVLAWMMGHLGSANWARTRVAAVAALGAYGVLSWKARELNALAFGEESAQQLGVEVERMKGSILAAAALAVGAAVAVCGVIGFVGLIVPHVMRRLAGPDHRTLIPLSAIGGGAFLGGADLLARAVFPPAGLPAGTVTALFGLPFFLWLLRRSVRS